VPSLITTEPTAISWRAIEPLLRVHHPQGLKRPRRAVETFSAAIPPVKAGFGDGLVALGLARAARLPPCRYAVLRQAARPVTLRARKTVKQAERFTALRLANEREAKAHFEARRGRWLIGFAGWARGSPRPLRSTRNSSRFERYSVGVPLGVDPDRDSSGKQHRPAAPTCVSGP